MAHFANSTQWGRKNRNFLCGPGHGYVASGYVETHRQHSRTRIVKKIANELGYDSQFTPATCTGNGTGTTGGAVWHTPKYVNKVGHMGLGYSIAENDQVDPEIDEDLLWDTAVVRINVQGGAYTLICTYLDDGIGATGRNLEKWSGSAR